MEQMTVYIEKVTGEPVAFMMRAKLGNMPVEQRGVIKGDKLTLTIKQGDNQNVRNIAWDSRVLFPAALGRLSEDKGLEAGTTFTLPAFVPDIRLNGPVNMHVKVVGPEEIEIFDRKVKANRLEVEQEIGGMKLKQTSWVEDDWSELKSRIQLMGLTLELVACPKAIAMAEGDIPEMMLSAAIPVNRKITDRMGIRNGRYRLEPPEDAGFNVVLPDTGMQKADRNPDGSWDIFVARSDTETFPSSLTPEEEQQCLKPSTYINGDDPQVKLMAKQAAGSLSDPWERVAALSKYVAKLVKIKNLNVGLGTSSEVARNLEGDCTEHAVLLAAMCRSLEMPSRVAVGVVYAERFGPKENVFVYHMWTQVAIDGQWVDVDAALDQFPVDATHICLGQLELQDEDRLENASALMLALGKMKIEIEKMEIPEIGISK
jgi:hypothetical protein